MDNKILVNVLETKSLSVLDKGGYIVIVFDGQKHILRVGEQLDLVVTNLAADIDIQVFNAKGKMQGSEGIALTRLAQPLQEWIKIGKGKLHVKMELQYAGGGEGGRGSGRRMPKRRTFKLHGSSSSDVVADHFPAATEQAIAHLLEHGADEKGIFRIAGSQQELLSLIDKAERGEHIDFHATGSIHVVAQLLKHVLRHSKEPLLTTSLYQTWLDADNNTILVLVGLLPERNRALCKALFALLHKVHENHDTTRMDASNLALLFAPSILRTQNDTLSDMVEPRKIALTKKLIEEHTKYF